MNDSVTQIREASDKPIAKLVEHAHRAIKLWQRQAGMTPRVMFKNTCGCCGQRGFVSTSNTVPQFVQCENCGNIQPYENGGYALAFELQGTSPHGYSANSKREVEFHTPEQATVRKQAPKIAHDVPTKVGCRCEADQTLTPVDTDALRQFCATLEAQNAFGGAAGKWREAAK